MNKIIQKSLANFRTLDILQQSILVIISSVFLLFFMQSFIFSSSLDVMLFRGVDDLVFQYVLRDNHKHIIQIRLAKLFQLYGYGYGWLFWIIHIVITFPCYLLSLLGIDFLLLSTARNISLLFMAGSCVVLFKSIKNYTNDKHIPYFAVLLFVSYPFFALSAMSFRTIAQSAFFSILTFYLTIRHDQLSKKDLKYIALSLAACLGTKISTGLLAPLVAIFLVDRSGFKPNKENFKKALYFLKYFIPSAIFLINPSLFLSPFKWSLLTNYTDVMAYHLKQIQTNYGSERNFLLNFQNAFFYSFLYKYIIALLTLGFLVKITNDIKSKKANKFDFLYIFLFLVASSTYLAHHIQMGSSYVTNYFFSFSCLLLFPLVILDKARKYIKITILITLVGVNTVLNFSPIKREHLYFYTRLHSESMQNLIKSQKELQKLVGDRNQELNFLTDYRAPTIYSDFFKNIKTATIFDNISIFTNFDPDYILLHKDSKMLIDETDFNKLSALAEESVRKTWTESRELVEFLIKTGLFKESKYELIYEKNKLIFFKRLGPSKDSS